MFRSMLAIAGGYITILILNSLVHLIISVYFRSDLFLTGISQLPSTAWVIGVTALQFAFGLMAGLLTSSLAKSKPNREITGFILLMTAIAIIDYTMLSSQEPMWYLIASPALKIIGIFTGFRLFLNQN